MDKKPIPTRMNKFKDLMNKFQTNANMPSKNTLSTPNRKITIGTKKGFAEKELFKSLDKSLKKQHLNFVRYNNALNSNLGQAFLENNTETKLAIMLIDLQKNFKEYNNIFKEKNLKGLIYHENIIRQKSVQLAKVILSTKEHFAEKYTSILAELASVHSPIIKTSEEITDSLNKIQNNNIDKNNDNFTKSIEKLNNNAENMGNTSSELNNFKNELAKFKKEIMKLTAMKKFFFRSKFGVKTKGKSLDQICAKLQPKLNQWLKKNEKKLKKYKKNSDEYKGYTAKITKIQNHINKIKSYMKTGNLHPPTKLETKSNFALKYQKVITTLTKNFNHSATTDKIKT